MSIYNLSRCSVVQVVLNFHLTSINGCALSWVLQTLQTSHAQPLSLCAANGQMQGQHPKGEHVEGMNLKSQCLGPKGISKHRLSVSSLPGTKWSQNVLLHFFVSRENPQPNNKWLDGNGHIHSFTLRGKQVSQSSGVAQYLPVHNLPGLGTHIPNCHSLQVSQINSGKCLRMIERPHHLQTHALPTAALPSCETHIHRFILRIMT